jgi:NUMOD3 motif
MHIYMIVNELNGKYYIGKFSGKCSLQAYLNTQLANATVRNSNKKPRLYEAMKANPDPANWRIHSLMSTLKTDEELCEREQFFIGLFKSQTPDVGYNIAGGGKGSPGLKWSEERKAAYSKRFSGSGNPMFGKTGRLNPAFGKVYMTPEAIEGRRKAGEASRKRNLGKPRSQKVTKAINEWWTPERRAERAMKMKEIRAKKFWSTR